MHATLMTAMGLCAAVAMGGANVKLTVRTDQTIGRVDERIYSHFFEHIYHSANGGLWGEQVWNRSFESTPGGWATWSAGPDGVSQNATAPDARLFFGDASWTDYEFSVEARKTGGAEGFLIIVRANDAGAFYWANLGGWGNQAHQWEHETAPKKRGAVGPRVPGAIEAGRWYRIRVRCEGPRLKLWLDDTLVLDFTDGGGATLSGRVGFGTWVTKAEFRSARVTALDGRELWSGVPPLDTTPQPAELWEPFGGGTASLTGDRPLNGDLAMALDAAKGPSGIRQKAFHADKGETYAGSVWVRGAAPQGLQLRLVDNEGTIGACTIATPTPEWREAPVRLKAARTSPNAALEIVLPAGSAVVDQVSLMSGASRKAGGFRPDLLKAVAALRPPVIRWPGGCYAEYYRWKDGVGPQSKRGKFPIRIWDDDDVNSLGTDEFIALCRRVGSEPLLVVNGGRHDSTVPVADYIREACEWIEYCNGPATSKWGAVRAANGHPEPFGVRYWEIDNETWPMGPEGYVKLANAFIPAMKAVDPTISILVCGGAGTSNDFGQNWNEKVIAGCSPGFDYLSIHHYEDPNRFEQGPRDYERLLGEIAAQIARSANPKARVFVSEWNAQSTDWRTGLYAAGLLNAFERRADVMALGSPALFLRHVSATDWDNALVNFDQSGWFPAPNYVAMKLWRDSYAPNLLAVEGDAGRLSITATTSEDRRKVIVKLVNPTDAEMPVEMGVAGASGASLKLIAPGGLQARNTLAAPDTVKPVTAKASVRRGTVSLTLPPLSAGVLTVRVR